MIIIKTPQEIKIMREGGRILAGILKKIVSEIRPGITTKELNRLAEELIKDKKALPAFKNYNGFPAALCTSINDQVVHGIPGDTVLKKGDIISVDLGIKYKGYFTDMTTTVSVGRVDKKTSKFLDVGKKALEIAIKAVKPGHRLGDVAHAVQSFVEKNGYSVVRDLVGHGVGKELHEEPKIPNFGVPGTGLKLEEGMTLAFEPMINMGDYHVRFFPDGWTVRTADGSLSAHFEHTVAVTSKGAVVITK